jgi:hypothetical protein
VGFESGFHDEIDFEVEGFAEVVFEFAEFDEAKAGFGGKFDEDVKVTGGGLFAAHVGAEDADLGNLVCLLEEGFELAEVGLDVGEVLHGYCLLVADNVSAHESFPFGVFGVVSEKRFGLLGEDLATFFDRELEECLALV